MSSETRKQFEAQAQQEGFSVEFSPQIARMLDYRDSGTHIEFTLDASEHGNDGITLEHHPRSMPRDSSYDLAFTRCRQFLEACGFKVEVYGDSRQEAEQGARANAGTCHAACDRRCFEMKSRNPFPLEARGAPGPVVAHL